MDMTTIKEENPGETHARRFKLYCVRCKRHSEFEACVHESNDSVKCEMYIERDMKGPKTMHDKATIQNDSIGWNR